MRRFPRAKLISIPRWYPTWAAALLAASCLAGCEEEPGGELVDGFTEAEWTKIRELSPLPEPEEDTTNAYADDAKAAALGQKLFFDKRFSGPIVAGADADNGGLGAVGDIGQVACVDCHLVDEWMSDTRSNPNNCSIGVDWTGRNSPTMVNVAFYEWFAWDGRGDTLWSKSMIPPESPKTVGGTRLGFAHGLWERYRDEYDAIFEPDLDPALDDKAMDGERFPPAGKPKAAPSDPDGAWEEMAPADQEIVNRIFANVGKSYAAYFRLLVSRDAPFDRYVAGDAAALDAAAKRGLKLFIGKAACVECHDGPAFTDNDFHNTAVPQEGEHVPAEDLGRYAGIDIVLKSPFNANGPFSDDTTTDKLEGVARTEADKGKFRTKHLRQIAETGPYMHNGRFATLAEVVEFYNQGGGTPAVGTKDAVIAPLNLTPDEVSDLVAFLQTLTGEPVEAPLLENTAPP